MSMSLDLVYDYLTEQKYPKVFSPSEKRTLRKRAENFTIKDGVLYYCKGWKILSEAERSKAYLREAVRNGAMKIKIVLAAHAGDSGGHHLGHQKVLQKLSAQYYWTGMHADVRDILKMCHTCMMGRDMVMDVDAGDSEEDTNQDTSMADQSLPDNESMIELMLTNGNCEDLKPVDGLFYTDNKFGPEPRHFWEMVEFDIFGPYPSSPDADDQLYVAVFMDGYSAWPEAFVLDNNDLSTLVMAIFKLISRSGVMCEIIERKRKYSKRLRQVFEELSLTECPVKVEYKPNSNLDSRWTELEKAVEEFVVNMPTQWYKYIDFCLLPYRISRSENLDYTPSFLSSSRELRLPNSISHQTSEKHVELHLSENQLTHSLTKINELFQTAVKSCERADGGMVEDRLSETGQGDEDGDWDDTTMDPLDDDMEIDSPQTPATPKMLSRRTKRRESRERCANNYGNLYVALKKRLQGKGYPPNYNLSMKRSIRKVESCFTLVDDVLFYKSTKGLKEVLMFDEDRLRALQKAHIDAAGKHMYYKLTYQRVSEHYYWKGISLDSHAFLQACPKCSVNASKSNEAPSTNADTPEKESDDLNEWYTDCTEELKPVIDYLKSKTIPEGYTERNETSLKMKTYSYTLDEGDVLHYMDSNYVDKSGKRLLRKVVFTPEEKEKIIRESHIIADTGQHKSKATTHSSVSVYYYWPNMAREVAKFIRRCEVCKGLRSRETTPSLATSRSCRPRTRSTAAAAAEEAVQSTPKAVVKLDMKKQKAAMHLLKRRDKFSELIQVKGLYGANMEDVQSDHGYSIQSPVKSPVDNNSDDNNQDNLSEIAGNEVEVQTEGPSEQEHKLKVELSTLNSSSLEPLSAAVELALAGEKTGDGQAEHSNTPSGCNSYVTNSTPASTPNTGRKGRQKHKCPECGLQFRGYIKFQVHMSSHTGEKPFTCNICGAKVRSIKSVRQHELRHKGQLNTEKRFLCDVCGKYFKSRILLKNHKRSSHGKVFTCPACEQSFTSKAALDKHEPSCSPEGLDCKICHQICASTSEYRAHVLNHAGIEGRPKLERIDPVTQEETMRATAEVEEANLVQVQIEISDGIDLPHGTQQYYIRGSDQSIPGQHQNLAVADGNSVSTDTSTTLASSENFESSLLQLAEQVVQAGLGERDVEYQIVYPDNTSQIVIVQHEPSDNH